MTVTARALLRDRYELLETTGAGGEARIVKAIDHQHERTVALKIRPVRTRHGRDGLLREARVLLGLPPNPALPLVRDDFFAGDEYVVVMDWVDGTDLATLVRDRGTPGLAPSSVLAYLAEVAEALTFLHTQSPTIVHGDVKPANIILTRGGHVKLVDFGLSSTLGMEGQRAGTVGYRAPELAAGAPPSRATDVFSLAATAFALLTGAAPAARLPTWEGFDPDQAAQLERALRDGLATDPSRRPSTPGEFVERLRAGWGSTLPTGVMTFCMTDIVDSTALWERDPAGMAQALVRHDELIAASVERHRGRFLKSMGEGDSTVSVFSSATEAVAAARHAQEALAAESWPAAQAITVRVGLHTGEAERHGTTYVGTTVNLAARVRGEASAGEILLSRVTTEVVRSDLPDGCSVIDLGPHRLKGLAGPERLYALAGPGLKPIAAADVCPYRGLLPFEAANRRVFFGREDVVTGVLNRLAPGRLLAVVGASGSGKSSVLRAGVVAAVESGAAPGLSAARLITPGPHPRLEGSGAPNELLVVDQFEELYTQCREEAARAAFVKALLTVRGPAVIVTRADLYGELSADPGLAAAVAANQILLGPMKEADLRRAVTEPARLAGLRLEPGLVDIILGDVAGEPGALPLMSHALRASWERRDGRTLTMAGYRESGGVSSAVAQTADAVAAEFPADQRALLRGIFLRLTELGDGIEDSRRRVPVDELVPAEVPADTVRSMLDRLAEARLLTLDEGSAEVAHEILIRKWPALRDWLEEDREGVRLHRRLGDAARLWELSGREAADLYRGARLEAAREWAREHPGQLNDAERAFLEASVEAVQAERDEQLRTNRRLRRLLAGTGALTLLGAVLVVVALLSRHAAVNAEDSARSQALATEAEGQIGRDPQRAILLSRLALAAAPTPQAELAATEALDANTARSQLPSTGYQECTPFGFALYDGGRRAAVSTCPGGMALEDLPSRKILRRIHFSGVSEWAQTSASGRTVLTVAGHEVLRIGVHTGRVQQIARLPFALGGAALDPAGRRLAVVSLGAVYLLDLRAHRLRKLVSGDAKVNVPYNDAWASNDRLLVTSAGETPGKGQLAGGLSIVDVRTGRVRAVALARKPTVAHLTYVAASPDRRTWYVTGAAVNPATAKQQAATWAVDARSRRVRWTALGPLGAYACPLTVSRRSDLIGVGYCQGRSDVLDARTGRLLVSDNGADNPLFGVGFGLNATRLVTASSDGVVRTWATHGPEETRVQVAADPLIGFTPDSRRVVATGQAGETIDIGSGRVTRRFPGYPTVDLGAGCTGDCAAATPDLHRIVYPEPTDHGQALAEIDGLTGARVGAVPLLDAQNWGPLSDGRILAAATRAGKLAVRVADPRTGRARRLQSGPAGGTYGCNALQPGFDRSETVVAIGDACNRVDVWNLRTGHLLRSAFIPDLESGAPTVVSPDGRYVLIEVLGGTLVRVDVRTGAVIVLPGGDSEGISVAASPDGRFDAISRDDGSIDVYDARTLARVRHHNIGSPVLVIAFSPDGARLAAESTSHELWVWDTCAICENPHALAAAAARVSVRSLTPGERQTFGVS